VRINKANRPPATQASTGFDFWQIDEICREIGLTEPIKRSWHGRKQTTTAFTQLRITLTYLRTNLTQAVIAEIFQTSQSTVSRIIRKVVGLLAETYGPHLPTPEDLDETESLIVDGTLAPTLNWKDSPENYSGKHHRHGVNLQVACTPDGLLRWVSDPLPGATHDAKAIRTHGFLDRPEDAAPIMADKGYLGLGLLTPIRKAPGQDHLEQWQKDYNREINQIRNVVERCIAHLKNWKILFTAYRRPRKTQPETITAVIACQFLKLSF